METASITISIIALVVSGIVAWKNYLAPFKLSLHSGAPRLERCPVKLIDGRTVMRFVVVLPLYFINEGAHDGTISDIVLIVHSGQNAWLFYPAFYCKYNVSTEPTLGMMLTKDKSNEPFYPPHLQAKETLYKPIVFPPVGDSKKFPLGDNPLLPGKYTFQVMILETLKKDYEVKLTFHITLSEEKISEFESSPSLTCLIPFIDDVQNKRQLL
jgi:hypothetical protein